ncbi:(2Fe-2S) ferredoxin domain-containing protein [Anaeroselena agilis]|uniref:(2Fe-2S) ferredoxin domain-containing protein n=1 Tax=Anaeroselena agilis TaxID=3063788 RepID=A0ABU3NST9_9FIRM|nr:(2Fe-2S) ferredoxin domain-containing protein [Selenomonadales bacterium 4137-cl]
MKIRVCIGSACHLKGSYNVINSLQQLVEEYHVVDEVEIHASFCLGVCSRAVSVKIDEGDVQSVSGATVRDFFIENVLPAVKRPEPVQAEK